MRVLMTGITGTGKKSYAEAVRATCAQRGVTVEIIHFEEVMEACDRTGTFRTDTMYHHGRAFLHLLCAQALDEVRRRAEEAERRGAQHVILEMHATYLWDHVPFSIVNVAQAAEAFMPGLVISLLDNVHEIARALMERTDAGSARFLADGYPLVDLLNWRVHEITIAEQIAFAAHRYDAVRKLSLPGFFLLSCAGGPSLLVQLLCESRYALVERPKRVVYASFAISCLKEKDGDDEHLRKAKRDAKEAIDRFREQLKEPFIVLDPYTITEKELADAYTESERVASSTVSIACRDAKTVTFLGELVAPAVPLIDGQIVDRDERLVRSAESVVIYLPMLPGQDAPAPSEGAAFERIAARLHGRDTVLITEASRERLGPFARVPDVLCATFAEAMEWFRKHGWIP